MSMDYDIPRPNKEQIERLVMDFARKSAQTAENQQETPPDDNARTKRADENRAETDGRR